ncbi:MAG TPA: restriction endonuclease subunit S, partial [Thermoanaerobaculia bacterium]|nr:restriction endonuclease subunit S [Thermoanaerobaculia bacterium]
GIIPEDWAVCRLDSLGIGQTPPIKAGPFGSALTKDTYVPTGYKVYGQEQVIRGDHLFGDYFITQKKYRELEACAVRPGDVLLSLVGTAGRLLEVPANAPPGIINPRLIRFSFDNSRVNPTFFRLLFESGHVQSLLERQAQGGTMGVLNAGVLRPFCIQLPPITEQRAIAAALSDVDALLEGLTQLIAKKRDLKQAARQQLLSGQTRLPGFRGEWEAKRLGDVADTDPENLPANTSPALKFNYIALENVDHGSLRSYAEQLFATAPSRARRKLRPNDVLVSTVRPNLRSHLEFSGYAGTWICSTGFCVVRCREGVSDPGFVFNQLFADDVGGQVDALLTGSNYPAINSGDVRALTIRFPPFAEQTAIAAVLSDMDAELSALEARRDKTRALKQAMMQELLTGRTRLV